MRIRLVVLDLDGTAIGDDFVVPGRVAEAIRAARHAGVHVTLATGRSYAAMRRYIDELGIDAPVIAYQGGLIADAASGAVLHAVSLPRALALEALELARARGWHFVLYDERHAYVEEWIMPDAFYTELIHPETIYAPDLRVFLVRDPAKFLLMDQPERIAPIQADLRAQFGERLEVVQSHARFVEGNPAGVSKGRAVAWVAERLGIAREAVMAVGDSDNDVSMLAWAGVGVAMGQGSPAARAAADWIAPTFTADGAAVAIERFALNSKVPS